VVNQADVVLGTIGRHALESDPEAKAIDVMQEAPSTYRPDVRPEKLMDMEESEFDSALVTTLEGKLVGLLEKQSIIDLREEKVADKS